MRNKQAKHLHIGKNDVIGFSFSNSPNVHVISHNKLSSVNSNYDFVTISAFDPELKFKSINESDFLHIVSKKFKNTTHLIYFSSARVLNSVQSPKYVNYVQNKIHSQQILKENFKNCTIIYLPVLFAHTAVFKSGFFDMLFENLRENRLIFDCDGQSSWNFVNTADLTQLVRKFEFKNSNYLILPPNPITVLEISRYAIELNSGLRDLKISGPLVHYPDLTIRDKDITIIRTQDPKLNLARYMENRWKRGI